MIFLVTVAFVIGQLIAAAFLSFFAVGILALAGIVVFSWKLVLIVAVIFAVLSLLFGH